MAKILVVEDDQDVCRVVCNSLSYDHHTVEAVHDGNSALERLGAYNYDLIVLDWQLPGISGVEVLKQFRASGGDTCILMLTGRAGIADKESGLDAGADDYLTKPFLTRELLARVRALLRRGAGRLKDNDLRFGNVELNPLSFRVVRDGQEVRLSAKEFALLEFLMRHPRMVFSPEALIARVWTADEDTSAEIVRSHIKNLRKKLDFAGRPSILHTVHGVGYKVDESLS